MSTEIYTSEIKTIATPQITVYNYLANLRNLEQLFDPSRLEEIRKQYPDAPDIKLDHFRATRDECTFTISPVGTVGVQIVEREASKLIKLTGIQPAPFQFNCWIQLLPVDDTNCKVKITLHAELNTMIKMLVNSRLKEGLNHIAEALTKIPYV